MYDALWLWQIEQARARGEDELEMSRSIGIPVVGETVDVVLNDISQSAVEKVHVYAAIENAVSTSEVLEGSHGGGTGMRCHGYKGGTGKFTQLCWIFGYSHDLGTSSRVVKGREKDFTVGVICQANYGQLLDLRVGTVPVGKFLSKESIEQKDAQSEPEIKGKANEGSCIVIIAYRPKLYPYTTFVY